MLRISEVAETKNLITGKVKRDLSGGEMKVPLRNGNRLPDHVLINDGVTTGIDFDEFCQYDPLFDVAHFMAHLRSLANCDALANRFLSAYRATAPDYSEGRIALHSAVSYFKLAHITATITRPPHWEHRLEALLDAAGGGKEIQCT